MSVLRAAQEIFVYRSRANKEGKGPGRSPAQFFLFKKESILKVHCI